MVEVGVQESVTGSYRPPVLRLGLPSSPPQATIRLPVQTAVCECLPLGAFEVEVGVQASVPGSYRPPVLRGLPFEPPQTTMRPPVQTAVCKYLPAGAFVVEVGVQMSVAGSYREPVLREVTLSSIPPQTTIWLPVQIVE